MGKDEYIVGIDLGTTNSIVAVCRGGDVEVITDPQGNRVIPSVLHIDSEGKNSIGYPEEQKVPYIKSVKRLMGKTKEEGISSTGDLYPISERDEDLRLSLSGKLLTPIEASSEILKQLKRNAEAHLGTEVKKAVITVPAYFGESGRAATKKAAELAGIDVIRLLSEPTAAAVSYGVYSGNIEEAEGKIYLVYDLGGGTFDVSLLQMREGIIRVLAVAGDNMLGGDDFDSILLAQLFTNHSITDVAQKDLPLLLKQARSIKEELTHAEQWSGDLLLGNGRQHKILVKREEFENAISEQVGRTIAMVQKCLADANVSIEDIGEVILVGGSSKIPLIHRKMEALTGKKAVKGVDPDEIVATGAAIQAASLQGIGSDHLLMDVTPLSLGLEIMGDTVEVLIPRNSTIPIEATQTFTNYKTGQDQMKIQVLQGEGNKVEQCRSLGTFVLKGIPHMEAGEARIEVKFRMDADGILTVSASEQNSGIKQEVEIRPSYGLDYQKTHRLIEVGQ